MQPTRKPDKTTRAPLELLRGAVDGVAVLHTPPDARSKGVILCLAGLSGSKEALARHRRTAAFADAGYAVVLCDHYNSGERRDKKLLSNVDGWTACQKAHFWPAIYRTACDVPAVVSWAIETFGTADVS
eukprot:6081398-Prymnesium_polylepis.1